MNAAIEPIDGGNSTLAELRRAGIDALVTALGPVPVGRQLGGVRQFGTCAAIIGERLMKPKKRAKTREPISFSAGVGRALRRAAKDAQKTARMYGTPLYVWENGKVVAKKP